MLTGIVCIDKYRYAHMARKIPVCSCSSYASRQKPVCDTASAVGLGPEKTWRFEQCSKTGRVSEPEGGWNT